MENKNDGKFRKECNIIYLSIYLYSFLRGVRDRMEKFDLEFFKTELEFFKTEIGYEPQTQQIYPARTQAE